MTDAADSGEVIWSVHDGWGELVLHRPARKNAITGPLGEQLAQGIAELVASSQVRSILFRGADGAFCSGLDLKAFNADPEPAWLSDFQTIWRGAHRALFDCPVPIVGALERYAINGGAALALACDLLVVGEESYLQVGEVQIGMAAPYNLAWLSLRHSEALMAQIALVGDRLTGADLKRMGIAHTLVDDAHVLAAATALCTRLAEFPPDGLRRIKAGVRARTSVTADEWFDRFTRADPVGSRPQPRQMR